MGGRSATVTGGNDYGAGVVTVTDTNLAECDGNANTLFDWDGDLETGIGGAFFGFGAWINDPDCGYGLNQHGGNVAVNDFAFGSSVGFVVGEVDQGGPIKIQDPTTGAWICETDGNITPCPNSGCGFTDDPDDCLSQHFVGTGFTCGTGGGDGGYWVILDSFFVSEGGEAVQLGNPPTSGTITAF